MFLQVFVDRSVCWKMKIAKWSGKRVLLYWIGTDCLYVARGVHRDDIIRASTMADINLACGPVAFGELESFGLRPTSFITPPKLSTEIASMPNAHAVLLSVPDGREDFYGYPSLRRLIDDFPNVLFHVVRSSKQELWEAPNVVFWGVLDNEQMERVYNQISIVVRFPEHDSTSMLLMEAAIKGKRLISRNPFPFAWIANDYQELFNELTIALQEPVEPHLDIRGKALELFDRRRAGAQLSGIVDRVLESAFVY